MWFESIPDVVRVLALGVAAYVTLIAMLRLAGKRALSKLNAFDWIVSVALGSILGSTIVSRDINFSEGAAGVAVLLFLQWAITFGSVRIPWLKQLVRSEPALLVNQGKLDPAALTTARVTRGEVESAIRRAGIGRLSEVAAVILETDGSFSVIQRRGEGGYDLVAAIDN